jgi:hypothetical protein
MVVVVLVGLGIGHQAENNKIAAPHPLIKVEVEMEERGERDIRRLTVIDNLTRHRGQGGEFVGGSLRVLACQSAHERTLAHRREADEANTGYACSGHIETGTTATTSAAGSQQFALELGQLGLKLAQME